MSARRAAARRAAARAQSRLGAARRRGVQWRARKVAPLTPKSSQEKRAGGSAVPYAAAAAAPTAAPTRGGCGHGRRAAVFLSLAPSAPAFDGGWQVQVGGWATGALCGAAPARAPEVSLRSLKKKEYRSIEVSFREWRHV